MGDGLSIMDDDGVEVLLDEHEASCLLILTNRLDAATVSACPDCNSRVLATVALIDLIDAAPPHPRSSDLMELADEAPTLHLYVFDLMNECCHDGWRDPLFEEWCDVVEAPGPTARR